MPAARDLIPNVLSIAGSDPSGGAGIQADLKTFAALGCHGMAVVTALTAQNTQGVGAIHLPPPAFVAEQIAMIFADIDVAAVKVGMLGSAAIVRAVADTLAPHVESAGRRVPLVVDPVLVSTSGSVLGDDEVVDALRRHLFPLATLITPNLAEAARLTGGAPLESHAAMEDAARNLRAAVPVAWFVKGGHRDAETADDLLLDDDGPHWLSAPRVATRNTHGTGCTLSSACAAALGKGAHLRDAVATAKAYVNDALAGADRLSIGSGHGPVDHFARWR